MLLSRTRPVSAWLGLSALLLAACSSTPVMRVAGPPSSNEPPHLERILDLGGLDLPASGELNEDESDDVATPGEWLALLGSGLSGPGYVVRFGTREVPVQGFTDRGGLLVRVPRGLGTEVDVSVTTELGTTHQGIAVESYVTVADIGASQLRFFPHEGARLGEQFDAIELKGLRSMVLSGDGALLYAISYKKDEQSGYRLMAIHMGAPESPAIAGDFELTLVDPPTALALSADDRRLFVLSEKSLSVFDLPGRVTPRPRGALLLDGPQPQGGTIAARSIVVLDGGNKVAVLDSAGDRLLVVDSAGAPQLLGTIDLKPPGARANAPPTSFDIVGDAADPHAVWVLSGPSSRFAAGYVAQLSRGLRSLLPGRAPPPAEAPADLVWPAPLLRRFAFEGAVGRETARVDLPTDFLPLDLAQGPRDTLWVSGLASDWSHVTLDPVEIGKALAKTTEIGRVLEVEPGGNVSTRLSGFLAVLNLTKLPGDDTPLYTAMRLKPVPAFPSIIDYGVKWVAESYKQSSIPLRSVEWTSILPPYLPPSVLAQ